MEVIIKLQKLRDIIKEQSLDGFIQPVHDEFLSEYPPEGHRRVEWLTGFSGSAGTVVVLADKAALFIDGRYTLQAASEVDKILFEQHNIESVPVEQWLKALPAGSRIGYDPRLHTQDMLKRWRGTLDKARIELVPVANLVDVIWKDRPALPATALFIHDLDYAGEEASAKRARMAAKVKEAGAQACVITAPDAVCWLLNVRAGDVPHTPLALANAILDESGDVTLFVSPARVSAEVAAHLGNRVELCDPARMEERLKALGRKKARVLCDPQSVPVWFTQALSAAGAQVVEGENPCVPAKAVKNPVELAGIRNAHRRDGAAIAQLLCWLDKAAVSGRVSEIEVGQHLLSLRAQDPLFREPSFTTIAGSGPNGAVVHYRVTPASNRVLQKDELFLLDSGGQYPDGTTDITRTVVIGNPSPEHKDRYTRVLKGHIAIATALFPEGTRGSQIDALARQYLWRSGLDYDHGTGHGVGCFLGVHEGPQRISKRGGDAPLKVGMVVSNEPGYYKPGAYGIRIENLVEVVEKGKTENGKALLGFETLTCAPLDHRLIDAALLTPEETRWLNDYHAWVLESLSPALDAPAREWLKACCAPI